ncbi:5298_t:CDS:1, partial [Racocetra persica]
ALLTVNAIPFQKREIEFRSCIPGYVFNVEMKPNPIVLGKDVTFDISATVTDDVGNIGYVLVNFMDADNKLLQFQPLLLSSGIKANETIDGSYSMPVKLLPESIEIKIFSHRNSGPDKEVA